MKWTLAKTTPAIALLINALALVQVSFSLDGVCGPTCYDSVCQPMCCDGADACCGPTAGCRGGGLIAGAELTFVKFAQEGGVTDLDGSSASFDLECAPRFELGYMGSGDVGFRTRYWFYDADTAADDGDALAVDTYYLDWELFHQRCIGRSTLLDVSLGLRYLDFEQSLEGNGGVNRIDGAFEGWGGTVGIEVKHPFWISNIYARGRWSVLLGDADMDNFTNGANVGSFDANDNVSTLTELGVGFEMNRNMGNWGVGSVRLGGEWQSWDNMAPGDNVFGGVGNDDVLEDVGFAGLVLRVGLER